MGQWMDGLQMDDSPFLELEPKPQQSYLHMHSRSTPTLHIPHLNRCGKMKCRKLHLPTQAELESVASEAFVYTYIETALQ